LNVLVSGVRLLGMLEIWSRLSRVEPPWVREYFWILYEEFGSEGFSASQAEELLRNKEKSVENIYKVLAPLQKAGLIKVLQNPENPRVRQYRLVALQGVAEARPPTRDELLRLLKSAADIIRTSVDYSVILLFLFYKVVSDKWEAIVSQYMDEGLDKVDAYILANNDYLKLYDEEKEEVLTWSRVVRKPESLIAMDDALIRIARLNHEHLKELERLVLKLGMVELSRGDKRSILVRLIELFNAYDFSQTSDDVLGDAYQWILGMFAPAKAKEGETYTPREVIKLIVQILDVRDKAVVLDPACGSAAMLIEAYNHVKEKTGKEKPALRLYGQELNESMAAIAKMNLILHGISSDAEIYVGDSLENPKFLNTLNIGSPEGGADYVIANPPWNQDGYDERRLGKPQLRKIYSYGYPPKNTADWAWIQLMTKLANNDGKVGVVIDNGALFRGGREKSIRSKIVEEDLVEAVILLPEKLFYNTGAPGVIMIFNKQKPPERKGKILFINASNEYEPHPEVRRLNRLGKQHIEKIAKAYHDFKDIEGFARVVGLQEIRGNDYNLNVTLYVTLPLETEEVDLEKKLQELLEIEKQATEARAKTLQYIQQVLQANKR